MLAARSIYAGGLIADAERSAGRRAERAGLLAASVAALVEGGTVGFPVGLRVAGLRLCTCYAQRTKPPFLPQNGQKHPKTTQKPVKYAIFGPQPPISCVRCCHKAHIVICSAQ